MPNLETSYMGLKLKNPIIVGSSGLTKSPNKIKACEDAGAGAVVIKSLFEEVLAEEEVSTSYAHPEAYEYLRAEVNLQYGPEEYAKLISDTKAAVDIPVIASINCVSDKWWPEFARKIENAGADALELNVFPMVNDVVQDSSTVENSYYEIVKLVKSEIDIPVSMKISMYFTALPQFVARLTGFGLKGLVLFNRFVEPDIDINKLRLKTTFPFTTSDDIQHVIRWIALLSDKTICDLSATTGIHTQEAIIKLLLAGASNVQLASVLYKQGFKKIEEFLNGIESWMEKHEFESIADFKGSLSFKNSQSPDLYLRSQFMERIRDIE